jgi:uncharacterized membrane protein
MPHFPPLPTWDSLHPLIVHFPIVLLLLSPLFILIGAILPPLKGRPYMTSALIILLGTISLFVASATGEAAATLTNRGGAVDAVLAAHEHLASQTEILFSSLSIVLAGMVGLSKVFRQQETRLAWTFPAVAFLVLYCAGILFIVNTAHEGGRLVHEFGVRATIPAGTGQPHGLTATEGRRAQSLAAK